MGKLGFLQDFLAARGLLGRAVSRGAQLGETIGGNTPSLGSLLGNKDVANNLAVNAIEAGGRFLPIAGAAWLGINAGPAGANYDTLSGAAKQGLLQ